MIDLSALQSGDLIFTRVRWDWKYLPSYLSRGINFFINLWSGIERKPYCPCNHVMVYINHNGQHLIYESDGKGFHPVNAYDRLKDVTLDNIWAKHYPINNKFAYQVCEIMTGTKYGWVIIFEQIIRQLSNEKISFYWLPWKGMVCSMTGARVINFLNGAFCKSWQKADPQDLYFDNDSKFIQLKNI